MEVMSQMPRLLTRSVLRPGTSSKLVREFRTSTAFRRVVDETQEVRAQDLGMEVKPNRLERFILVSSSFYRSFDDIPDRVSFQKMKLAIDIFRGRFTIALCVFGFVACYGVIVAGRRQRNAGEMISIVHQQEIRELRAEGLAEEAAAAAAAAAKAAAAGKA